MGYPSSKEKRPNSLLFSFPHCRWPIPTVTRDNSFTITPFIFLPPNVPDAPSPSALSPPPSFSLAGLCSYAEVASLLTVSHRQNFHSPLCTHSSLWTSEISLSCAIYFCRRRRSTSRRSSHMTQLLISCIPWRAKLREKEPRQREISDQKTPFVDSDVVFPPGSLPAAWIR